MSGGPLRNGLAPVPQGVTFFHDVSEHRRELQAISLLSRVVEQTADSVMLTDKQGKIEYVNPAFAEGLHQAAKEFAAYEPQNDDITSVILKVNTKL